VTPTAVQDELGNLSLFVDDLLGRTSKFSGE
jgi:hypothetical protein